MNFWIAIIWLLEPCPATQTAPIVENGLKPVGAELELVMIEDLRIGGPDAEGPLFWAGTNPTLSVDRRGHFFIADPATNSVIELDAQGRFIRNVAREGKGPGEFSALYAFHILADGRGLGFGGQWRIGKHQWFDQNMKFVKKTSPPESVDLFDAWPAPDGRHFGIETVAIQSDAKYIEISRGISDQDYQVIKTLSQYTIPIWDGSRATDPKYLEERYATLMAVEFNPSGLICFGADNTVFTAVSDRYQITKWDPNMTQPLLTFRKAQEKSYRNQAEIENYIEEKHAMYREAAPAPLKHLQTISLVRRAYEKAKISRVKHPLLGLISGPEGYLLGIRQTGPHGRMTADIFDDSGHLVGELTMDHFAFLGTDRRARMSFHKSFAYTLETDEDGNHQAVRYRYSMKTRR